jgi:hypothetical protein
MLSAPLCERLRSSLMSGASSDMSILMAYVLGPVSYVPHRIVDVSTVGELCARWFPREHKRAPRKKVFPPFPAPSSPNPCPGSVAVGMAFFFS